MSAHVWSPVLIGRAAEFDRLRAELHAVEAGRSSTVVVAGEAGVGKTRLVSAFADAARDDGVEVLVGGCIDLGDGTLPYAPVVEALRGLVARNGPTELDEILGPARAELSRLIPDLGHVDAGPPVDLKMGSGQGRLFELLLGVLGRLAARTPVLLILEDLHWSDRSTRDLLAFLVRNLHDARVMLVLTYRSDELHRRHPLLPFLAELERSGLVERLELRPFDLAEASSQLRAIAGDDLDQRLIDSIHARSGGNPFFAEELLACTDERTSTELPQTLRDVLLARIADLTEPTQEVLRVASAAGQRVDPSLLAEAAGIDEARLYDALRECVSRQVLVPDPTAGVDRYLFRHALLGEAVYDDLLPGERIRLHAAFARSLEARAAGDELAAELAYHWYAAHDLPRALAAAVAAGRAAEARYAFPEASAQYERALELWDQVPDAATLVGVDRLDVLVSTAGVCRFHDAARASAHIREAIRLAEAEGDPIRTGLLNERLGRYAWIAGQGELAQDGYRNAMRLIPAEPPSEARARAIAGLAQVLILAGRFEDAASLTEEGLALARAVGVRDVEGHLLNTRGSHRAQAGDADGAIEDMRAALAIAEETGVVDDVGRAYANWIWVLDICGRLDEAIALADEGLETAARLGLMRFFGTHMLCNAADYLYRLGRWDEAAARTAESQAIGPFGINRILTEEMEGRLAMATGRADEAAAALRPLWAQAEQAADIQFIAPVGASLAELALWSGRPDEAGQHAEMAIRLLDFSSDIKLGELYALGVRAAADRAESSRARRSAADERAALDAGDALAAEFRTRHERVVADRPAYRHLSAPWLALIEAEMSRLHRRPDPEAWAAAVASWDELGRPYSAAYARWREAEAILASGSDRSRATASLRDALDVAEGLGAAPLAREIRALAMRGRLSLDRPADGAPTDEPEPDVATDLGLTGREREVLGLVALGRTNRQIAEALFISENTAGVHVSNILGKLGVASRGEAAAVAYQLGLAGTLEDAS